MALQNYRELRVWQQAMEFVRQVYELAAEFPAHERFGLTSQLQRAAVSVPANIAQGYGRLHRGDYIHHLSIARGSLCEAETCLILAAKLNLCDRELVEPVWRGARKPSARCSGPLSSRSGTSPTRSNRFLPVPDTRYPAVSPPP